MALADKALRQEFLKLCEGVEYGSVTIHTPEGDTHHFGAGEPRAELYIRDWAMVSALASNGQVGLGEAYVQGLWDSPSVETVLIVAMKNRENMGNYDRPSTLNRMKFRMIDTLVRNNSRRGSRRNIRAHYDVGNEFYRLWLDDGMTYSSALFADGDDCLSNAQDRKNDRIISRLSDGERVLEVGCGWGGFAERATQHGRDVTGITISRAQHAYADSRLDGRARIEFRDYRDQRGQFDNIVSVEMIEAVGERHWPSYFSMLKQNLAAGGRAVVQAITVDDGFFDQYRTSSDFIRQYVFPGGMLLSDSHINAQAKSAGLQVKDSFGFGRDYARTCRIWAENLLDKRDRVLAMGHSEEFLRNWQYYLESCAASFQIGHTDVVQVELAHA